MKRYLSLFVFICFTIAINAIEIVSRTVSVINEREVVSAYGTTGKI